jgi:hypothetical protein
MKWLTALCLVTVASAALADPCQLSVRTVTQGQSQLTDVYESDPRIWPEGSHGWYRCEITVRARIGDRILEADGRHSWGDGRNWSHACMTARVQAIDLLAMQAGTLNVQSTKTLTCHDNLAQPVPASSVGSLWAVGYVGPLAHFPVYSHRTFSHPRWPSSLCLQFTNHRGRLGGVICSVGNSMWQVVDLYPASQ